jgi:hypothetical protein
MLVFNQTRNTEPEVRTMRIQREKMAQNHKYNNVSINDSESSNFSKKKISKWINPYWRQIRRKTSKDADPTKSSGSELKEILLLHMLADPRRNLRIQRNRKTNLKSEPQRAKTR